MPSRVRMPPNKMPHNLESFSLAGLIVIPALRICRENDKLLTKGKRTPYIELASQQPLPNYDSPRFKYLCGFRESYPFPSGLCFPMQIGQGE